MRFPLPLLLAVAVLTWAFFAQGLLAQQVGVIRLHPIIVEVDASRVTKFSTTKADRLRHFKRQVEMAQYLLSQIGMNIEVLPHSELGLPYQEDGHRDRDDPNIPEGRESEAFREVMKLWKKAGVKPNDIPVFLFNNIYAIKYVRRIIPIYGNIHGSCPVQEQGIRGIALNCTPPTRWDKNRKEHFDDSTLAHEIIHLLTTAKVPSWSGTHSVNKYDLMLEGDARERLGIFATYKTRSKAAPIGYTHAIRNVPLQSGKDGVIDHAYQSTYVTKLPEPKITATFSLGDTYHCVQDKLPPDYLKRYGADKLGLEVPLVRVAFKSQPVNLKIHSGNFNIEDAKPRPAVSKPTSHTKFSGGLKFTSVQWMDVLGDNRENVLIRSELSRGKKGVVELDDIQASVLASLTWNELKPFRSRLINASLTRPRNREGASAVLDVRISSLQIPNSPLPEFSSFRGPTCVLTFEGELWPLPSCISENMKTNIGIDGSLRIKGVKVRLDSIGPRLQRLTIKLDKTAIGKLTGTGKAAGSSSGGLSLAIPMRVMLVGTRNPNEKPAPSVNPTSKPASSSRQKANSIYSLKNAKRNRGTSDPTKVKEANLAYSLKYLGTPSALEKEFSKVPKPDRKQLLNKLINDTNFRKRMGDPSFEEIYAAHAYSNAREKFRGELELLRKQD